MEDNILMVEETVNDIVEVANNNLKDKVVAYGVASVFLVGVGAVGYVSYKGVMKLLNMRKKAIVEIIEENSCPEEIEETE